MRRFLYILSVIISLFFLSSIVHAQGNQTVTAGAATTAINFPGAGCTYNWVNDNPAIGLPASGTGNIPSFTAVNTGTSPLTATITATPVSSGFAYIADFSANNVSVINTATNQVVSNITVGSTPVSVSVSPDGSRVYVANIHSDISVINTATNSVVATIYSINSDPVGISLSPDGSLLYVVNEAYDDVSVISTATNTLVRATIAVGNYPKYIAVSAVGNRAYVINDGSFDVSVINTLTNAVIATIPVGPSSEQIAVSPDGSRVYVSNTSAGAYEVFVINTATNTVISTITTNDGAYGIVVSPDGSRVYVNVSNATSVIDAATNTIIATMPVGIFPLGISINKDGSLLYVVNSNSQTVSVINTANNTVAATIVLLEGSESYSYGNFVGGVMDCNGQPVSFTITVNPAPVTTPTITAGPATGTISACAGTASASPNIQQFTVSGSDLSADIVATAPNNFEVSLSAGSGFGNRVTLPLSGSVVNNTVVYVRSAASAPAGSISGNVTLVSGAINQKVPVTAEVNVLPTVNAVANQTLATGTATTAINFTGTANTFNWVNDTPGIGLAASGTGNIASFTAINTGSSPVTATITATPLSIGFAYINNAGANTVSVVNTTTNVVAATITVGLYPVGIAISHDGNTIYTANSGSDNVSVIDARTNTVIATVPAGSYPYGLLLSPDGNTVYVANQNDGTLTVINTATNTVSGTIKAGAQAIYVAANTDGSRLYVSDYENKKIYVVNTTNNSVIATINTPGEAFGLALSADGSKLYVGNYDTNYISVVNTSTNMVVSSINAGIHPQSLVVSSDGKWLYAANSSSSDVSVINLINNSESTIPVQVGPQSLSLSSDGNTLYVPNSGSRDVSVIDIQTKKIIATVAVGYAPISFGNFLVNGTGCSGVPITFTITVNPESFPTITAAGSPSPLTTIYGTPSTSTTFGVSGSNLTTGILVTPPPGFEVSIDGITYSSTVTVSGTGTIATTTVYIRLVSSTPVGDYSGNIVLTSAGATNANVEMPVSMVTPAPLTITADDKSKTLGEANPVLTITYSGFVNNDGPAKLTTQPAITTTAETTSPAGQYPITAAGAAAPNYTITYAPGVLTINPQPQTITVPNAFTPNGDGVNDTWDIRYLNTFPNCTVAVFNRWGQNVYSSNGYGTPWDGSYKGNLLPTGTYYYMINLRNGLSVLSGYVAIIR